MPGEFSPEALVSRPPLTPLRRYGARIPQQSSPHFNEAASWGIC